ncbi:MAG TPA: hypothetical protein VFZ65_22405 [Planctomycetota bacterium]|nr:hypothetical protein [Planctomycetota bacterium]
MPNPDHDVPFQRATSIAGALPAVVKSPPATRSPFGSNMSASTRPFMPAPNADHEVPFQRAMLLAVPPPAIVNEPPATRSPFGSAARAPMTELPPLSPLPSADHDEPFQRAMLLAGTPPAVVKKPPATRSPLGIVTSFLTNEPVGRPVIPAPSGDQDAPFQLAT